MTENEKCIHDFYTAFKKKDAENMVKYYSEDIVFSDPAFGELKGEEASMMWKMLCSTATDLAIRFKIKSSIKNEVKASWEADYTFSRTGKKVHNEIEAVFTFKDGLIVEHKDSFNLHKWASQAIGWKGYLLGGSNFFKKKLNQQTRSLLQKYMKSTKS